MPSVIQGLINSFRYLRVFFAKKLDISLKFSLVISEVV